MVVVAGICSRNNKLLLSERKEGTHLSGHWEFPGGKVRSGEPPELALAREWREELGVEVLDPRPWNFAYQPYAEKNILLLFFHIDIQGNPAPQEGQKIAWLSLEDCHGMNLADGDRKALDLLTKELETGS